MATANMDNSKPPNQPIGVYKNPRLMHACTTIVGFTVHLQTKDGSVWEGVFYTFSPEFTICLNLAVQIDPKLNRKDCLYAALKSGSQAKDKAFFDLKDIVRITAVDVDLNYATKDLARLTTDADISGYDANKSGAEHRQLESWQDDDGDSTNVDSLLSLDDVALAAGKNDSQNNSRGWDAQEMFRFNERVHKVTTTYDEKLTDYTVPLPKHNNSKEWRNKQERAAAIAKEIESNSKSQSRLAKEDEGDCEEEKFSAVHRPVHPTNTSIRGTYKNFRPRLDRRVDSLKNFGKQLTLAPSPRLLQQKQTLQQPPHQHHHHHQQQPQQQQQQQQQQQPQQPPPQTQRQPSPTQSQQKQSLQQHRQPSPAQRQPSPTQTQQKQSLQQPQHQPPAQRQLSPTQSQQKQSSQQQPPPAQRQPSPMQTQAQETVTTAMPPAPTTTTSSVNTSDSNSAGNQAKDHQSELARKSKLNPHAKEFVYKPRSPAAGQGAQTNGANQASTGGTIAIEQVNPNMMSQAPHAAYYQQVPLFPHGLSSHQQQHHAAQFLPNHTHFPPKQIHYMPAVAQHFAQSMPPRHYINRGNFQNYHHRGEHHNNVRVDYSQASVMATTSTGQPFVPPPSGAPHTMNAYAASPQQPMLFNGPPQSMYPMVQASFPHFPQHMPHVMSNPPYPDGSTVYINPSQNYIVNP